MGWNGTIRSASAAYRRGVREYEREERQRFKELERERKELDKMEALEQAAYEVESFENLVDRLTTVHKEPIENIDWEEIAKIKAPPEPQKHTTSEDEAVNAYSTYKPNFLDKIFRLVEKKKERLRDWIAKAKVKDERDFQDNLDKFRTEYKEWDERTVFARRVVEGETSAFHEVVKELNLFEELENFGSRVEVDFRDSKTAIIGCHVKGEELIPREKKTLTQTGKLSVKNMPKGEFYEHFQDHVCSSALRIAHELFESLPLETAAVVTISNTMLNSSTGYLEDQPILSVTIPRATLDSLNLDYIDASDSMSNFIHNMNFKKTSGFAPVERLCIENIS